MPTSFLLLIFASLALSTLGFQQTHLPSTSRRSSPLKPASSSPLFSAHFASDQDGITDVAAVEASFPRMVRNRLRQATGFSFTVFRATLRGITGISLTTVYAGALAASGLWIRKTMSAVLSVFPSGFRYFLQPFLVMYYTPIIVLRSLTSPTTRKRAVAKHETVMEAWKEAVVVAEKTEAEGYWPVVVSDDGYFELSKPPSISSEEASSMAEAMAETVEQAMELKSSADDEEDKKK